MMDLFVHGALSHFDDPRHYQFPPYTSASNDMSKLFIITLTKHVKEPDLVLLDVFHDLSGDFLLVRAREYRRLLRDNYRDVLLSDSDVEALDREVEVDLDDGLNHFLFLLHLVPYVHLVYEGLAGKGVVEVNDHTTAAHSSDNTAIIVQRDTHTGVWIDTLFLELPHWNELTPLGISSTESLVGGELDGHRASYLRSNERVFKTFDEVPCADDDRAGAIAPLGIEHVLLSGLLLGREVKDLACLLDPADIVQEYEIALFDLSCHGSTTSYWDKGAPKGE